MFENMGFDVEDYKYMKGVIVNAVERVKEFAQLETRLPPEGM